VSTDLRVEVQGLLMPRVLERIRALLLQRQNLLRFLRWGEMARRGVARSRATMDLERHTALGEVGIACQCALEHVLGLLCIALWQPQHRQNGSDTEQTSK
jgi:hypothetical protein